MTIKQKIAIELKKEVNEYVRDLDIQEIAREIVRNTIRNQILEKLGISEGWGQWEIQSGSSGDLLKKKLNTQLNSIIDEIIKEGLTEVERVRIKAQLRREYIRGIKERDFSHLEENPLLVLVEDIEKEIAKEFCEEEGLQLPKEK